MLKRQRQPKTGICALCGSSGTVTREHVPPKCLFIKPRPTNTITVPLCKMCNHSYHLDDEYFRVFAAGSFQPNAQQWQLWNQKVVGSSFARSGGLRARLSDYYEQHREYAKNHKILFDDGTAVPEELFPFIQPFEMKRVNAVLEKIIKCLYYYHFNSIYYCEVSIEQANINHKDIELTISQPSGQVGFNREFLYRFREVSIGQIVWWLVFFQYHAFTLRAYSIQHFASGNSGETPRSET